MGQELTFVVTTSGTATGHEDGDNDGDNSADNQGREPGGGGHRLAPGLLGVGRRRRDECLLRRSRGGRRRRCGRGLHNRCVYRGSEGRQVRCRTHNLARSGAAVLHKVHAVGAPLRARRVVVAAAARLRRLGMCRVVFRRRQLRAHLERDVDAFARVLHGEVCVLVHDAEVHHGAVDVHRRRVPVVVLAVAAAVAAAGGGSRADVAASGGHVRAERVGVVLHLGEGHGAVGGRQTGVGQQRREHGRWHGHAAVRRRVAHHGRALRVDHVACGGDGHTLRLEARGAELVLDEVRREVSEHVLGLLGSVARRRRLLARRQCLVRLRPREVGLQRLHIAHTRVHVVVHVAAVLVHRAHVLHNGAAHARLQPQRLQLRAARRRCRGVLLRVGVQLGAEGLTALQGTAPVRLEVGTALRHVGAHRRHIPASAGATRAHVGACLGEHVHEAQLRRRQGRVAAACGGRRRRPPRAAELVLQLHRRGHVLQSEHGVHELLTATRHCAVDDVLQECVGAGTQLGLGADHVVECGEHLHARRAVRLRQGWRRQHAQHTVHHNAANLTVLGARRRQQRVGRERDGGTQHAVRVALGGRSCDHLHDINRHLLGVVL
eukprot:PhM_4_TR3064/c4_g1_i1/m.90988